MQAGNYSFDQSSVIKFPMAMILLIPAKEIYHFWSWL